MFAFMPLSEYSVGPFKGLLIVTDKSFSCQKRSYTTCILSVIFSLFGEETLMEMG